MRHCLALAVACYLPVLVLAGGAGRTHDQQEMAGKSRSPIESAIQITINPEARVSAALVGALLPVAACGTPSNLSVKVINQGFVTARLEAQLVGDLTPGVTLDFGAAPLQGVPQELRELRITLTKRGLTDLTIAFKAHNDIPDVGADLGGRDRVHFLMRCL